MAYFRSLGEGIQSADLRHKQTEKKRSVFAKPLDKSSSTSLVIDLESDHTVSEFSSESVSKESYAIRVNDKAIRIEDGGMKINGKEHKIKSLPISTINNPNRTLDLEIRHSNYTSYLIFNKN